MFRSGLVAPTVALVATASLAPQARADSASNFITSWDPDHDGTLNRKELGDRVTKAEFMAADTDHDGTLDKMEYQSIIAQRFQAANRDSDTTIDVAELRTPAGHRLLQLRQA